MGEEQDSENNNSETTPEELDDPVLPYCGENPVFKGASAVLDVRYAK